MKEDILEQLCEEYLQMIGYFTVCNVKFQPDKSDPDYEMQQDAVASDVDVIGFDPRKSGPEQVMVCSCKSWQEGFFPKWEIKQIERKKIILGREAWRHYSELCSPKWATALRRKIKDKTGRDEFVYCTVVTKIGDGESKDAWENYEPFKKVLGCPIRILTLNEMIDKLTPDIGTTVANSSIGRILQLLNASGFIRKRA